MKYEKSGKILKDKNSEGGSRMASENNFKATVDSLFKGMDSFITAKTVVGEAITVGDTIILPLIDVTFGVGAGAFSQDKISVGGGMQQNKCVAVQMGTRVNIKNQRMLQLLDMVSGAPLNVYREKKNQRKNERRFCRVW